MLEACGGGHRTMVELLIHGATVLLAPGNTSPLLMSCLHGHAGITTLLLEHRVNVSQARSDGLSPLRAVCGNGHAEVARLLLRQTPFLSPDSDMAFRCTAINGHREVAQLLVVNGVPAKSEMSDGTSVLMQALLGFLPPAHRGCLLQSVILVFTFMGTVAGHVAANVSKFWHSKNKGAVVIHNHFDNFYDQIHRFLLAEPPVLAMKSSGAVPFTTMFALLVL